MPANEQQAEPPEAPAPAAPTPAATAEIVDPIGSSAVGAYSQREFVFHEREAKGELSFEYIVNDGQPNHLIWCVAPDNSRSENRLGCSMPLASVCVLALSCVCHLLQLNMQRFLAC